MTATTDFAVTVWPGIEPRLLRQGAEDYSDYRDSGGYRPLDDADGLLNQVDLSGVLGRGGAAFPLAVKLKTVRDNGRTAGGAVVVANGEEGEPASIKDRWLLRHRPHLVLDGLRLAARMVSADRAHVYVSDRGAAEAVQTALAEIDGRRPRRAVDHGVDGRPRLRRRRGDGRGARAQRRPGQADGQAAAPVRRGRRPPSDHGEQCRDARADPVHPSARRRGVPRTGHVDVAGDVPRDDHRRGQATGAVRTSARPGIHRAARIPRRACRSGARRADGRLLRRPAEHATFSTSRSTTSRCAASTAGWAAERSRSSPRTARWPSRRR